VLLRALPCARSVEGPAALTLSVGLTYFGNRLCPFANRAWWAIHEKGVADEARAGVARARGAHATATAPAAPRHAAAAPRVQLVSSQAPLLPPSPPFVFSQFTYVHIDLGEDKPAWYKEHISPAFGTLPCVYDAGTGVFESAIIVEYLEDKFPGRGTALLPTECVATPRRAAP
jgi:glutathione S-transferase